MILGLEQFSVKTKNPWIHCVCYIEVAPQRAPSREVVDQLTTIRLQVSNWSPRSTVALPEVQRSSTRVRPAPSVERPAPSATSVQRRRDGPPYTELAKPQTSVKRFNFAKLRRINNHTSYLSFHLHRHSVRLKYFTQNTLFVTKLDLRQNNVNR